MKSEIAKIVYALGEYYNHKLNAAQISMYADDLMALTPEDLIHAIKEYRRIPENVFFPLPAKLISIIRPVESELDIGRIVAGRIITAAGKFGYTNPDRAREYIGSLGWEVVRLQGGWKALCELSTDDLKTEQPRLRDLAISVNKRSKLGKLNEAPALPGQMTNVTNLVASTMKKLGAE